MGCHPQLALGLSLSVCLLAACSFDWDKYDPMPYTSTSSSSSSSSSGQGAGGEGGDGAQGNSGGCSACGGGGGGGMDCGNDAIDAGEQCDDGNNLDNDGCDGSCNVECDDMFNASTFHCYTLLDSAAANWNEARIQCAAIAPGCDLAAVSSQAEHAWITGQPAVAQHLENNINSAVLWMGGTDTAVEDTWVWSNGEPFYDAWVSGEPNDGGSGGGPGEDCAVYLRRAGVFGFDDRNCTSSFAALCELPPAGNP